MALRSLSTFLGFLWLQHISPFPWHCRPRSLQWLWCCFGAQVWLPGAPTDVGHGKFTLLNWGFNSHTCSVFIQTLPPNLSVCSDSLATFLPFFHFPSCLCLATVSRCLPNIPQYSKKSMLRDTKFLLALKVGRGVLGSPSHKA